MAGVMCSSSQVSVQSLGRTKCCSHASRASFMSGRQLSGPSLRIPRQNSRQVTRMGLFGLGVPELAVIAGVAVLVFGPSKLPQLGKELGKTVKSFQTAAKEFETELKQATEDIEDKEKAKLKDDGDKTQ